MRDDSDLSAAPPIDALEAFLAGQATVDEMRVVRAWAGTTPFGDPLADFVRSFLRGGEPQVDPRTVLETVHDRIRAGRPVPSPRVPLRKIARRAPEQPWIRATPKVQWSIGLAAAALVIGIGVSTARRHVVQSGSSSERVYATGIGQRTTVALSDGTTVTLAPASRLTLSTDFGRTTRDVVLEGEARFDVVPAARAPFTVRTGAVRTRVLGTSFDVRRYTGDRTTRVVVISGRVATGDYKTPTVLVAGAIGDVTDSSVVVSNTDDPARAVSWTEGRLVFNDTPVPVLLTTVGRWYGYEFRMTDTALLAHHVSVTLNIDKPAEAMGMLRAMLGVSMSFDGNVVTLRPERDRTQSSPGASRTTETNKLLKHSDLEVGR